MPDAPRRLELATNTARVPRCAFASNPRTGTAVTRHDSAELLADAVTASANSHRCTADVSPAAAGVSPANDRSIAHTGESYQHGTATDLRDCSKRVERAPSRTGWIGRVRTQCQPHPATSPVRTAAASMSRSDEPIPSKHAKLGKSKPSWSKYSTQHGACKADTTGELAYTRCYASTCRTNRSMHGQHTGRSTSTGNTQPTELGYDVHSQLTLQGWPRRKRADSEIFFVAQRTKTDENSQALARECVCAISRWCPCTGTIFRWQQISDTSSHGSTIGDGGQFQPAFAAVGIESCEELIGSSALQAEQHRAPAAHESPGDPHKGSVILQLETAIPMTPKEASMHQIRDLYPLLCRSWPDTAMMWGHNFVQYLPDLDPNIRALVTGLPCWSGEPVTEVHLYIDGSSFSNRQQPQTIHAAWAFIVVTNCRSDCNDSYRMYAATSHQLSSADMSCHEFHGVGELTNDALSAEGAGMLVCMAWIAQSPFAVDHVVHYDNATIRSFSAGDQIWNADWEHSQLKANLSAMRHCFQALSKPVTYQHVKAHQGHPLNETADALAKATAKGIVLNMPIPCEVSTVMLNRNFPLAWMTLSPANMIPLPYALPGLFKAEGPNGKLPADPTWNHMEPESVTQDVEIHVQVASANVLTLAPGAKAMQAKGLMTKGRIHLLQAQFQQAKVHIIGIQESRTQDQLTRHNGTHLVFQSGASKEGSRGCELWLDRTIPYATTRKEKFFFQANQVHVAMANDRSLFAIITAPHFQVRILVLHAPHQAAKDVHVEEWWSHIQKTVQSLSPHLPIVILGDMNAKLGSVRSEAVDSHGAEEENTTGHMLHSFMLECGLWAPATFSEHHEGPTHTWISSEGMSHRLDFAIIPREWQNLEIHSKLLQDVDLCTTRDDHLPISLEIRMQKRQSSCEKLKTFRIDPRKCGDPALQQQFKAYLHTPPEIPWEVGIGEHAEILTAWLQQGAKQCFKPSKMMPRQKYMSALTWNIAQTRKQLLKLMQNAEKHVARLTLLQMFHAWKNYKHTLPRSDESIMQIPVHLISKCRHTFAWALHHRNRLHQAARHSSRTDRVQAAQETIDQFLQAAQGHNSRALYKKLQPLLGQTHRRALTQFRPIPAVRMPDRSLAPDQSTAEERWRSYFAEAEQGQPTTVHEMQAIASTRTTPPTAQNVTFDLKSLPTLEAIETYIKRAKIRKSPGVDGLPSEIYRIDPSCIAKTLWPLFSKCAIRCNEPLRWKGGEVCSLPKKARASHQVEHFRSILLADFMSKINHGLVRQLLLPSMMDYRHCMQAGGIPKLGTDMLHLYINSFAQYTRQKGASSALLFVDIKQAFYRACRALLVSQDIHESTLVHMFAQNGWSPDMYRQFRQRLAEPNALAQASVSSHLMAQVGSMLSNTWFQLRNCPKTLTRTECGTRPGDSIADLLYAFLMGRFIHALRDSFCHHGLDTSLELQWIPAGSLQPGEVEPQRLIEACWVDDVVLVLQADQPDILISKVQTAVSLTQDLAVEFGLTLNFGPDKTAALLALRGPNATQVRRQMLRDESGAPQIQFQCQSLQQPGRLDVVASYVYLGQVQDMQGHQGSEVRRRFILSQATNRILRKSIFKSPKMPQRTRKQLFQSLVLSKLLYGAGSWQLLHIHTARSWHSQVMKLYAQIVARVQPGPQHYHLDTIASCDLPHPMMLLTSQRFSLFDRIMESDMGELYALLQHQQPETSWFQQILQDVHRLSSICPSHKIFEVASQNDITQLAQHCVQHHKALTKLAKWAQKHYLAAVKMWKTFRTFQAKFEADAQAYGFEWTNNQQAAPPDALFQCSECQAVFPTYKALCTHTYKKHDDLNVIHRCCASNTCKSCLKVYHSRAQTIHHLRYMRTGCLVHLMAVTKPMTHEEVRELLAEQSQETAARNRQERNLTHKRPMMQGHGPKLPWPWQRHAQLYKDDARPFSPQAHPVPETWIAEVLQQSATFDVEATYHALMTQPYHGVIASQLVQQFEASPMQSHESQLEGFATLHEAISLWQDTNGFVPHGQAFAESPHVTLEALHCIRHSPTKPTAHEHPLHLRRQLLMDQIWIEDSPYWQIRRQLHRESSKAYTSVRALRNPCVQNPVFLYIFSGRRRQGDFQSHLEMYMTRFSIPGYILMIDLALSEAHDVGREDFENLILAWIRQGFVGGILIAPPCETWSEARYLETDRDSDPRPIRTADDPFGLATLTLTEWMQINISSFLLFVTIRVLFAAALHSVPAIVEHPKEPKKQERASIWRLPWMRFLEARGGMVRHLIWQGEYGATVPKPTHFGAIHLPAFKAIMKRHRRPTDWKALQRLGGRDSTGAWRTSYAKEYPSGLNQALADVIASSFNQRRLQSPSSASLPEDVVQEVGRLYAGNVNLDQQTIQPDFHRPVALNQSD